MIALSAASTTTLTNAYAGKTTTALTDTLSVSYVELNFDSLSVYALIQRGTMVNGVFVSNMAPSRVRVSLTGSFVSDDGQWSGTIPNWSATVKSLRAPYEQLLLSTGLVSGTQV